MRCATRISERIGDTEIDHLSGRAEAHHAYLVYVTESKRWSSRSEDARSPDRPASP